MKQLLILSGKGGTGKTTIAGAFIKLSNAKAYADCDVDAPNLHLITQQNSEPEKTDYYGLPKAEINPDLCITCDQCRQSCRFDAIFVENGYKIDSFACEGCGVCEVVCPVEAISLKPAVAGELMLYANEGSVFSTAQLKMGSGTSGMLVTEVKQQMKTRVANAELAIIDGSPGIGCPVIASLSGVDMVLIVAEPSLSGISDMERIINTAARFGIKTAVCINKFNTNLENTDKIELFCKEQGLPLIGKIPFDSDAVKAINNGQTIVDIDCASGRAAKAVYNECMELLFKKRDGLGLVEYTVRIMDGYIQNKYNKWRKRND
jgi:MinD superfamily P-loop ATPase